jgi:hypothetical protein
MNPFFLRITHNKAKDNLIKFKSRHKQYSENDKTLEKLDFERVSHNNGIFF